MAKSNKIWILDLIEKILLEEKKILSSKELYDIAIQKYSDEISQFSSKEMLQTFSWMLSRDIKKEKSKFYREKVDNIYKYWLKTNSQIKFFHNDKINQIIDLYDDNLLELNNKSQYSSIKSIETKNNLIKFDDNNIYFQFLNALNTDEITIVPTWTTYDDNIKHKIYFCPKSYWEIKTVYIGFYYDGKITWYWEFELLSEDKIEEYSKNILESKYDLKDHYLFKLKYYKELNIVYSPVRWRKKTSIWELVNIKKDSIEKFTKYLNSKKIKFSEYKNWEVKVLENEEASLIWIDVDDYNTKIIIWFLKHVYGFVFWIKIKTEIINNINYKIDSQDLYNILISLVTSNFLIFSWPSGTWKSSIVRELSEYINSFNIEKNQIIWYKKIPIKSNFSDETSLLWYWNSLLSKYEWTETLEFLIESYQNQDKPYFLLLDEMNLSRIENYFSDFLARLDELKDNEESSEIFLFETQIDNLSKILSIINLVKRYNLDDNFIESDIKDFKNIEIKYKKNDDEKLNDIPDKVTINWVDYFFDSNNKIIDKSFNFKFLIKLSKNLKVIWTINEDETTQSLSNKVLDRSQFINFEIWDLFWKRNEYFDLPKSQVDLIDYEYQDYNIIHVDKIFDEKVHNHKTNTNEQISEILNKVNKLIIKINQNESIAYRVIWDIWNYLKEFTNFYDNWKNNKVQEAFDYQVAQKVLTKLKTFNLNNDTQKDAFREIWEIFWFETDQKKDVEIMKWFANYPKTLKFYNSLYSNLLDE